MYGFTNREVKRPDKTSRTGSDAGTLPMMRKTRQSIRWLEWAVTVAFAAAVIVFAAAWLSFQHKPGWYQPVRLDEAGVGSARSEAVGVADFVSDRMVGGRPFDVVLTQRSVNGWLAALQEVQPESQGALPPEIREPAIGFADGEIRFGAHYEADGWQAIVSVGVTVDVSEDADTVRIALSGAHGGSLPVPKVVLENFVGRLLQIVDTEPDHSGGTAQPLYVALREVDSVDDLFEGVRIRNRFVWFNGERPFRINSVTLAAGELRMRVEPL